MKSPAYGFGSSKRQTINHSKFVPGPGAYENKSIMGTESKGKSLARRLKQPTTSNM